MSYVIQNFYQPSQSISFNNKFKLLLKCVNILKIFLLFRFFLLFKAVPFFIVSNKSYPIHTYKFFFCGNPYILDSQFYIKKGTNHLTRIHKRSSFFGLQALTRLLDDKSFNIFPLFYKNKLLFNTYFFSTKIFFFSQTLKTYKPFFLYFFLNHSLIWSSYSVALNFNNIFLFYSYFFRANYFINNRFFKIYNL